MGFSVDFDGAEAMGREVEREIANDLRFIVKSAADAGADEARTSHRYKDKTGTLTKSIRSQLLTFDRASATAVIEATAPYAQFVEGGTKPHDIWPKEGHGVVTALRPGQSRRSKNDIGTHRVALRWFDDGGGIHFARMVHHQGSIPMPFMGIAYVKSGATMERDVEVMFARLQTLLNAAS